MMGIGTVVFVALSLLGIMGNGLVCLSIAFERRLQNPTNLFLCSLAVADLFVSATVMPLAVAENLSPNIWIKYSYLCLVYVTFDVFLCTVSIMHITVIAIERCVGITRPLASRTRNKTCVLQKIILVWLVSAIISSPVSIKGYVSPQHIMDNGTCAIFWDSYKLVGSIVTFYIPFLIISMCFVRTVVALNRQLTSFLNISENNVTSARPNRTYRMYSDRSSGGSDTNTTGGASPFREKRVDGSPKQLEVEKIETNEPGSQCLMPGPSSDMERGLKCSEPDLATRKISLAIQIAVEHERRQSGVVESCRSPKKVLGSECNVSSSTQRRSVFSMETGSAMGKLLDNVHRASSIPSLIRIRRKSSANQCLQNERKATQVLGIVFVAFFVCWTPFFSLNCAIVANPRFERNVPPTVFVAFLWLGYLSSVLNPLIYTIFNQLFRKTFYRLLTCRYKELYTRKRQKFSFSQSRFGKDSTLASATSSRLRIKRRKALPHTNHM